MSVYILTSPSNVYAELKSAINADSNLTLVYDNGVDDLICTHSALGIAIKFEDVDRYAPKIYVGTGYTTGTTVDNSFNVAGASSTDPMISGYFIVGLDYIVVSEFATGSYYYCILIGKITRGDVVAVGGRGTANGAYHWARGYNITLLEPCEALFFNGRTLTAGANYAKMPLYIGTGNAIYMEGLIPQAMVKFCTLFRSANTSIPVEVLDTNLVINISKIYDGSTVSGNCIVGEGLYL